MSNNSSRNFRSRNIFPEWLHPRNFLDRRFVSEISYYRYFHQGNYPRTFRFRKFVHEILVPVIFVPGRIFWGVVTNILGRIFHGQIFRGKIIQGRISGDELPYENSVNHQLWPISSPHNWSINRIELSDKMWNIGNWKSISKLIVLNLSPVLKLAVI